MKEAEAIAIVQRMKYKPGAVISLLRHPYADLLELRVSILEQNADDPNPAIVHPVTHLITINPEFLRKATENDLIHFIRNEVINLEIHEVDEWLRLDGKFINDPHPELRGPK